MQDCPREEASGALVHQRVRRPFAGVYRAAQPVAPRIRAQSSSPHSDETPLVWRASPALSAAHSRREPLDAERVCLVSRSPKQGGRWDRRDMTPNETLV